MPWRDACYDFAESHPMDLNLWLAIVATSTALLIIPGPTIMMTLSYALTQGRRVAVASALGVAAGDLIAMTLSVIGLGALFLASAVAFNLLKWIGAVYLVWLGIKMLRGAGRGTPLVTDGPEGQKPSKVFCDLALVTALNPKSNTFFVAFVPQFITPDAAFAPQAAILIATFVGLAGINALCFALAAHAVRGKLTKPSVQMWLTRAGGATLITMGILTASLRKSA
jgi:threonine/homoserine/homoserine lactone efflux protein